LFAGGPPVLSDDQAGYARKIDVRGDQFVADPVSDAAVLVYLLRVFLETVDELIDGVGDQSLRVLADAGLGQRNLGKGRQHGQNCGQKPNQYCLCGRHHRCDSTPSVIIE